MKCGSFTGYHEEKCVRSDDDGVKGRKAVFGLGRWCGAGAAVAVRGLEEMFRVYVE